MARGRWRLAAGFFLTYAPAARVDFAFHLLQHDLCSPLFHTLVCLCVERVPPAVSALPWKVERERGELRKLRWWQLSRNTRGASARSQTNAQAGSLPRVGLLRGWVGGKPRGLAHKRRERRGGVVRRLAWLAGWLAGTHRPTTTSFLHIIFLSGRSGRCVRP